MKTITCSLCDFPLGLAEHKPEGKVICATCLDFRSQLLWILFDIPPPSELLYPNGLEYYIGNLQIEFEDMQNKLTALRMHLHHDEPLILR